MQGSFLTCIPPYCCAIISGMPPLAPPICGIRPPMPICGCPCQIQGTAHCQSAANIKACNTSECPDACMDAQSSSSHKQGCLSTIMTRDSLTRQQDTGSAASCLTHPRAPGTDTLKCTRMLATHDGGPHLHRRVKHLQDVSRRLFGDWGGRGGFPPRPLHAWRIRERVVERRRRLLIPRRPRAARLGLGCEWVLRRARWGAAGSFWGRASLYMSGTVSGENNTSTLIYGLQMSTNLITRKDQIL